MGDFTSYNRALHGDLYKGGPTTADPEPESDQ